MSSLVWITGASTGIGKAVAEKLVSDGWTVAGSARNAEKLQELEQSTFEITSPGATGTFRGFPCDVSDRESVRSCLEAIRTELGDIDLAILNAGTHQPMSAGDFKAETVRHLMDVNLMGVANALESLLPDMLARRTGMIYAVSSVAGYRGLPTATAYGASKAALINMIEALKPDCDAAGVHIGLINPGFVRTPLTDLNEFPMPFLMEADEAATKIVEGIGKRKFEVTFPRRLSWSLKLGRILPYALYFPMVKRMTGAGR